MTTIEKEIEEIRNKIKVKRGELISLNKQFSELHGVATKHPTRNKLFQVSRVYETVTHYQVWAADRDDAIEAVNHGDWHSETDDYLGPSESIEDEVTRL